MVLLLLFQAAGGVQGVAMIVAPRACAPWALDSSVAQLLPPVVEVGSMRTRRIVRPSWLAPVPKRALSVAELNAGIQASAPPKPRMVCAVVPKLTVAVCALAIADASRIVDATMLARGNFMVNLLHLELLLQAWGTSIYCSTLALAAAPCVVQIGRAHV